MIKRELAMFKKIALVMAMYLLMQIPTVNAHSDPNQATASVASKHTIVVGRVSTNPKKHLKHLKPMADYLAANLSDFGITEGNVIFAKNNEQMIRYLKQGKVDLISETIFSATEFQSKADAEIVLRRWKKGVPEYFSLIFTHRDSDIQSFEDLVGKTIAFQDSGSTSAYLLPAAILVQNGYKLYQLNSPREKPPAHAIGFVFARKELNISAWVNKGIVAAGAFSNLDWNNEEDMPKPFHQSSRIIYQSIPFPRGVELIRTSLDNSLKQQIIQLLISADQSEEGQKVLRAYQKTKKFDPLSSSAPSVELALELHNIVNEQL